MADVDEIIDYIKSLKKGFDKELFQSKIEELSHAVDTVGLEYDDFHTLFKVWLNITLPITKWVSLGACLVPPDRVEEKTVEYAFRWILANFGNHTSFPRIGFLLDWLTAAMDSECIEMSALDPGYELFYTMLTFETLTVHAMKLVYTMTRPIDVTRKRVLELLDYAKKREGKKSMYRQLQVLLGLFKSYKPECVPEDVPAISIHTAFKKINESLMARYRRVQERRNSRSRGTHYLMWVNPLNSEKGRNKKADPLVPNMEFVNVGSKQYAEKEAQKNYLDFSDAVSLLQYSIHNSMSRPARLRALLCNETGLMLLAVASDNEHAFLSHDLHHLLTNCFLDGSPHTYAEKQDLLRKLAVLQKTLMQGLPIVTRFLAQYLPLWNERDYFSEIMELVEWIHVDNAEQVQGVVDPLTRIYHRSQPLEQCAILDSLTTMYTNLVQSSKRPRYHFMSMKSEEANYSEVLPLIAGSITRMCNAALQTNTDDMYVLFSSVRSSQRMSAAEARFGTAPGALPSRLVLSLPLLSISAGLLDHVAALMITYKKIFVTLKAEKKIKKDQLYIDQINTLKNYTCDLISCLYGEEALRGRQNGLTFNTLHPQLVGKLYSLMPDVDSKLSIRNHLALAPYTFMQLHAIGHTDADNKLWFDAVVDQEFPRLSHFLRKAVPELHS